MNKRELSFLLSVCLIILSSSFFGLYANAQTILLTRTLKVGSSGSDIITLQKILNSDPDTQVAASGVGSSGQESSYFGVLTQNAVVKFQNKYASDILLPAGLSAGNGFVGPLTLKKLNAIASKATPSSLVSPSPSTSAIQNNNYSPSVSPTSQVVLYAVNPYQIKPGSALSLYGYGFSSTNNTITVGSYTFSHVPSTQNQQISVVIPSILTPGTYDVSVVSDGVQAKIPKNAHVSVTISTNPAQAPTITSVTPLTVSQTDVVTIKGTGFSQNNIIYSPLGSISGVVSPDGKTLTFTPSQLSMISQVGSIKQHILQSTTTSTNTQLSVPIVVVTDAGPSNSSLFILK